MTATTDEAAPQLEGAALVAWLESPDGEAWSMEHHAGIRWNRGAFFSVKDDHPQTVCLGPSSVASELPGQCWDAGIITGYYWGKTIRTEIREYGMNGIPEGEETE